MSLYDWKLFAQAESFLQTNLRNILSSNSLARQYLNKIQENTSTSIFDWVDHMILPEDKMNTDNLTKIGFEKSRENSDEAIYRVPGSILFPLILKGHKTSEVALAVENIEDARNIYGTKNAVQGLPNSSFRKFILVSEENFVLSMVERRGSMGYVAEEVEDIDVYLEALDAMASRQRRFVSNEEGIIETEKLLKKFDSKLSKPRLADAFFRAERHYWESRNRAAQVQKSRQDSVGLGWGNMDHHTFRSSRRNFAALIGIFEGLGLKPRERFHAGAQAGWGAQILEDGEGRNVVFADVDLSAEEKEADFAHRGLVPRDELGTVGLWAALHGESILQAGMHHLAAKFNFDQVQKDLQAVSVGMMKPFSNFPFLKQAFTQPEKWQVNNERLTAFVRNQRLSPEQASTFAYEGTVGSHLENIQRGQGFKGFNQNSVSAIIKWTNPLAQQASYA